MNDAFVASHSCAYETLLSRALGEIKYNVLYN